MLRKLLLPILATAALAGCATGYNYRGGNGDYYYGQPSVDYRYQGMGGYGSFGLGYGFDADFYYDSFGRRIYGYPGGLFGSPYYGGNGWYRPRPHRGHGDHDDDDDGHGSNHGNRDHEDRPPPWRNLGGLQQRDDNGDRDREDRQRPMRPMRSSDVPIRPQRAEPSAPVIRQRSEPSSRMGSFIDGARRAQDKRNPPPEE